MPTDAYLGIDIGTSSVKVVAVTTEGRVVASSDHPLVMSVPKPGWSEQNPEDWWAATISAVSGAVSTLESDVHVKGIGLSGQMHSLVALDRSGSVIRPAILWNDVRSTEQCDFIFDRVGGEQLMEICGNPPLEGFTATKLLWIRQHEPENYDRIAHIMLAKDYIRFRLTGEMVTEPSDAAGTLLFDIRRLNWSPRICELLGIDVRMLPPVVASDGIAGRLTREAAAALNLESGTPVVGGGADNACAAAGSGVAAPGMMLVTIGTSGAVVAPIDTPAFDPGMRIHSMNHASPGLWYLMGVVLSAGAALAWWRQVVGQNGHVPDYDDLIKEAAEIPAGSDGLTYLPYLTGERTPHGDANARGVFAGLNTGHSQAHMTRAVLEGVSFALLDSVQLMRPLGAVPDAAVVVGGGARNQTWRRIVADVLGIPLKTNKPTHGAPLGAAMLAAVGAGTFSTIGEAGDAWLSSAGQTDPLAGNSDSYAAAYERYRTLYPSIADWFETGAQR